MFMLVNVNNYTKTLRAIPSLEVKKGYILDFDDLVIEEANSDLLRSCLKQGIEFINATRQCRGYIMRRDYGLQPSLDKVSSKQGVKYKMNNLGFSLDVLGKVIHFSTRKDTPTAFHLLVDNNTRLIIEPKTFVMQCSLRCEYFYKVANAIVIMIGAYLDGILSEVIRYIYDMDTSKFIDVNHVSGKSVITALGASIDRTFRAQYKVGQLGY